MCAFSQCTSDKDGPETRVKTQCIVRNHFKGEALSPPLWVSLVDSLSPGLPYFCSSRGFLECIQGFRSLKMWVGVLGFRVLGFRGPA